MLPSPQSRVLHRKGAKTMRSRVLLLSASVVVLASIIVAILLVGESAPGQESDPADPVLVGAGDIAKCDDLRDEATATLLDGIPGTVFTTGDNAYESGTAANYQDCYEPS
jgi:acid phosphatase type 7